MDTIIETIAATLPAVPAVFALLGLLPGARAVSPRLAVAGTVVGLLFASLLALGVMWRGAVDVSLAVWPGAGLYVDGLSILLVLLTSVIGLVVTRYSLRYLDGNPGQPRFLAWVQFTLAAVYGLICARDLCLFIGCWAGVSLGLHRLLTFFPERPAAWTAAWKKFVISRLGDACLVAAAVLAWRMDGTLAFPDLYRLAATAPLTWEYHGLALLLVVGAMTKSAQVPFHTWLPETMETPTPVSALMHAGIINAGGFLVVRLSPIIAASEPALALLLVVGSVTASLGSVVMLTQTDVKRGLAYSTVAQMGFMMMQCGLGAFASAVLHIVAHGLYKAHAFLAAGSAAQHTPGKLKRSALTGLMLGVVALLLAVVFVGGVPPVAGSLLDKPGGVALGAFLAGGVGVVLFAALAGRGGVLARLAVASLAVPLLGLYLLGLSAVSTALGPLLELSRPSLSWSSPFALGFSAAVAALALLALLVGWTVSAARWRLADRLYVWVLNGFYLADLPRLVARR